MSEITTTNPSIARSRMRERALTLLFLVLLVASLFLGFNAMGGGNSGRAPEFSSYSYEPWGVRGFYEYLQQEGFEPRRLRTPLLSFGSLEGLLIIVGPDEEAAFEDGRHVVRIFTGEEVEAICSWVAAGNTVLLLASGPNELYEHLDVEAVGALRTAPVVETHAPLVPIRELTGVEGVPMPEGLFFTTENPEAVAMLGDPEAPSALVMPWGSGLFFLVSSGWPMTNLALSNRTGNRQELLRFLADIVALHAGDDGEVAFDEAHHGFSGELGLVSFLKRHSLHYAGLQLALVFLFAVWRLGASFGRPVPARPPRERDLTEHLAAVANIYRRARLRREAVSTILGGLARDLASSLRLPPGTPAPEILAELERVSPDTANRFRRFLARARAVDRHTRSHEFVETCRQALELRALTQKGNLRAIVPTDPSS